MTINTPTSELAKTIASNVREGKTIRALAEGRSDAYNINPYSIVVKDGFNVRNFETPAMQTRVQELAQSIATRGLLKPLEIRMEGSDPVLIDGETRLRAVFYAIEEMGVEITSVKILLVARGTSDADATMNLYTQNDGLALTPLQKGMVFKRLQRFGWSLDRIAEESGLTAIRVGQLIDMTGLPSDIQGMIEMGQVSATFAWQVYNEQGQDADDTLTILTNGVSEAAAAGRTKVTKRTVDGEAAVKRPSFKKAVSSVFTGAKAEIIEADENQDEEVMIVITREQFDEISELLGMTLASE